MSRTGLILLAAILLFGGGPDSGGCSMSQPAQTGSSRSPQAAGTPNDAGSRFSVLVFSKTAGYRHDSISAGTAAIQALGSQHNFDVDATEDAARFTDDALGTYQVVVFLNTTGDILDAGQE